MSTPSPMDHASEYGFWIIWSPEGLRSPRYRHGTLDSAEKEAERLAELHKGIPFYVLAAVARSYQSSAKCVPLVLVQSINEDDIPF